MLRSLPNDKSAKLRKRRNGCWPKRAEIEAWWTDRRLQDEDLSETLKMEGFNQGYAEGSAKAELEMKELMEQATLQASELLQLAHQAKEDLIQEAEPFGGAQLQIAEKVLDRQLTIEPDFTLELIRKNLARKREKGSSLRSS